MGIPKSTFFGIIIVAMSAGTSAFAAAPVTTNSAVTTAEDTAKTITLPATDTDTGDTLTFTIVTLPNASYGTLKVGGVAVTAGVPISGNSVSFVPKLNWNSGATGSTKATFTFKATDAAGHVSNTSGVAVTVTPVNDKPTAAAVTTSTVEDSPKVITLKGSDVDAGTTLTYAITTLPTKGTVTGTPAAGVTYTPNANVTGTDVFYYTASDGSLTSVAAKVTIGITAVNDAPTATAQSVSAVEDTALPITLAGSDIENSPLTFAIVTQPAQGTLSAVNGSSVTYTPHTNATGADSFTFKANDGVLDSAAAAVSITIDAVNDAPTCVNVASNVNEDVLVTQPIALNCTDPEGQTLTYSIVTTTTNHYSTPTITGSNLNYRPKANFIGPDTFTYKATDASGAASDIATGTITVVNVNNDAPALTVPPNPTATTNEDVAAEIQLAVYASDPDGDALDYVVTSFYGGTVEINDTTGVATFTPSADQNGSKYFMFKVTDPGGLSSAGRTAYISVTAVNDAPTAAAKSFSMSEDALIKPTINLDDAVSDPETFDSALVFAFTAPAHGTLSSLVTRNPTYTPNANFNGTDAFTYTVTDATGATSAPANVTMTVTPVNDAPTCTDPPDLVTTENTPVSLDLKPYGTDLDGDALTFVSGSGIYGPKNGTVTISSDGIATFTPDPGKLNPQYLFSFSFNAKDPALAICLAQTVGITVNFVNELPVANPVSVSTNQDTAVTINMSLYASDEETASTNLTFTALSMPAHGTLSVSNDYFVNYTPTAGFSGEDAFDYKVTDDHGGTATSTVTITVNPDPNDAPVANDMSVTTPEESDLDILPDATDADGDVLTFTFTQPAHGTVTTWGDPGSANYKLIYEPAIGFSGADSFTYTATDPEGLFDSGTVTVTVSAVNDAPTALSQIVSTQPDTPVTITLTGTDPEGDTLSGFAVATAPQNGTVSLDGNIATYTPNSGASGVDSFTFTVTDGSLTSTPAQVAISIVAPNEAPVAEALTGETPENTPFTIELTASDPNAGDRLTYLVTDCPHGDCALTGSSLTYTPAQDFDGTAIVAYRVSDGEDSSATATVTITVTGQNQAPVAKDGEIWTYEGVSGGVALVVSDPESAALTFTLASPPASGTVTIENGYSTYAPNPDFNGTDSFTFTANDGALDSNAATVTVNVEAVETNPLIETACPDAMQEVSHIQTDSASGRSYWDNRILVITQDPATPSQIDEMTTTSGGTGTVCSQSRESSGGDVDDGFGFYLLEMPASDLAALANASDTLVQDYVVQAKTVLLKPEFNFLAPATDAEAMGSVEGHAVPGEIGYIQLPAAYQYLRALTAQSSTLNEVKTSLLDSGLCADSANSSLCEASLGFSGIVDEFQGIAKNGFVTYGTLVGGSPLNPTGGMPLGLIDPIGHGSNVGAILGGLSNGIKFGTLDVPIGNGIAGGAFGLKYDITSYILPEVRPSYNWTYLEDENRLRQEIFSSMCRSSVANHSWGYAVARDEYGFARKDADGNVIFLETVEERQTQKESVKQGVNGCPNTLFVFAAGNSTENVGGNTLSVPFDPGASNVIAVSATKASGSLSDYSNSGSASAIAAPGDFTSYAAPFVAGTGVLIKAVKSDASPRFVKDLLIQSATPSEDGIPRLDAAAAVLNAVYARQAHYAPMVLKNMSYYLFAGLDELRVLDGFSAGTHDEIATWSFDASNRMLSISRDSTENAPSPGMIATPYDGNLHDWRFQSHLTSLEDFSISLGQVVGGERKIPVMTVLPKGHWSYLLDGKSRGDLIANDTEEYLIQSYNFSLSFDVNQQLSDEAAKNQGFHIPLARASESRGFKVPYAVTGAQLSGNWLQKKFGGVVTYPADLGAVAAYDSLSPPSYDGDITTQYQYSGAPPAYQEASTGVETITSAHVDATFDDFTCELVMDGENVDRNSESEVENVTITATDDIVQTFTYDTTVAGSIACTVTAHVTLTYYSGSVIVNRYSGWYMDAPQTVAFDVSLNWDLTQGAFPALDLFAKISEQLQSQPPTAPITSYGTGEESDCFSGAGGCLSWDYANPNPADVVSVYHGTSSIDVVHGVPMLPANLTHDGQAAPGFGLDMQPVQWAHGVGAVKKSDYASDGAWQWEITEFEQEDRSVP